MKLLKEVRAIEVKRTFAIADHVTQRKGSGNNRKFLKELSEKEFNKRLSRAKKAVLRRKEKSLDKLIAPKFPKRIKAYNASQWFLAEASPKEIGVWRRAGNLPLRWTNDSLYKTAERVMFAINTKSKLFRGRPKHSIPNILKLKTHLEQKEKYLFPIVFKGGTGTKGRSKLKKRMKGDIDDGCMRAIALALSGKKSIKIYFGIPPKAV